MDAKPLADNSRVAAILFEVSELLRIKGEKFKPQAYATAARSIEGLREDITLVCREGRLREISGVGVHLAEKIEEILKSGRLGYLEDLRRELPPGVLDLAELEGIGPKKAIILNRELGITTRAGLEAAARAGKIRLLPGFGEISEKKILQSLTGASRSTRFLLGEVLPIAEEIVQRLRALPSTRQISLAGSLRRRKETVGDVDILATSPHPSQVMDLFCSLPAVARVLVHGPTRSSVVLGSGIQVDLRVVREDQYGAALQYFSGSKEHNIALRRLALGRNWKLNEYGLVNSGTGERIAGEDEEGIYRALDLPFIEPELRENRGEIEAAQQGNLPLLIPYTAVRGDFHVHSSEGGGSGTIRRMAEAARSRGYEYIAICDPARSPEFPAGLTAEGVARQAQEIERASRGLEGIEILAGIECSIADDGTLQSGTIPLGDLDLVLGGVHASFLMPGPAMTARMIAALENENLDIIAHPAGRMIPEREGGGFGMPAFFRAAAARGILLEINGSPSRLDLPDIHCRKAKEAGLRFALGSDARSPDTLGRMELGVATARRGWLESGDCINTLPLPEVRRLLGR